MVKVYMIQVLKDVDCGFTISICFRLKTNKDLRNCLVNNFFQSSRISLAGTVYYIWSVVNGRPAEIGGRGQISPGLSFRKLQWSFTSFSYSFISLLFYFLLPIFFFLKDEQQSYLILAKRFLFTQWWEGVSVDVVSTTYISRGGYTEFCQLKKDYVQCARRMYRGYIL